MSERWRHLSKDLHKMSTPDLAWGLAVLSNLRIKALKRADIDASSDFGARIRSIEAELARRQLTIDDELELLRARNDATE